MYTHEKNTWHHPQTMYSFTMRSTSCWGHAFRVKQSMRGGEPKRKPLEWKEGFLRRNLNKGSQHTSSTLGVQTIPSWRLAPPYLRQSLINFRSDEFRWWLPPRSSSASDASDAISLALGDVETDENGGKALCNVNCNSPPPWPSSPLHLFGQKTATSSQTKGNF